MAIKIASSFILKYLKTRTDNSLKIQITTQHWSKGNNNS
jgi:hypothetical protein